MATGASVLDWDGTLTTLLTGITSALATGNWNTASNTTIGEFNNTGAADKWPMARAVLTCQFATITGIEGKTVDIFAVPTELDGVAGHDSEYPTATIQKGAIFLGSFRVSTGVVSTDMYLHCNISLLALKKFKLAIKNNTGQSMAIGWTVKIEGYGYNTQA